MKNFCPSLTLFFHLKFGMILIGIFLGMTSPGWLKAQETINGTLEPGDIVHPQRFHRSGDPSTTFPGFYETSGSYYYDLYRFHNPFPTPATAEVVIFERDNNIFHAAYLQNFDYSDPAANFLYTTGSSDEPATLTFEVPGESEFIVLVQTVNGLETATYEVQINAPFRLGPFVSNPELSVNKLRPFRKTLVGKSSHAQTLTFTNTGEGPLTDLSVKRSGKHQREFRVTRLSASLAPEASATVKVTFKPRSPGRRRAALQVTSNSDPVVIPVSGPAYEIAVPTPPAGGPSKGPRLPIP